MNNIIDKMRQEIIDRSNRFEEETRNTKDEYNVYNEHIIYVCKYIDILSKNKDVDYEVLMISALLHDIAMTDSSLDRDRHNEYGAKIAEKLLRENNYPEDKIQLVKKCILNHSNKRINYRTTDEEKILVDADCLSHFDSIYSIYTLAHDVMELSEDDSLLFVKNKLTKDYNELSDDLKYLIQDKYAKVMKMDNVSELTAVCDNEYEIFKEMNKIKYGWLDKNNNIHIGDFDNFSDNYILQSVEEVKNNGIGVCWDQVELERKYFKNFDEVRTFFIVHFDGDKCPTHTFLTFKKNYKYYWFENSWEIFREIHEYDTINELLEDVKSKFIKYELNNNYDNDNLFIFEYTAPESNISVQDFFKHCTSGKKIKI